MVERIDYESEEKLKEIRDLLAAEELARVFVYFVEFVVSMMSETDK